MKNRGLLRVIKLIELRPLYLLSLTVISLVPFAINYLVAAFFADMTQRLEQETCRYSCPCWFRQQFC